MSDYKTQSERYFLQRFGATSLSAAAEAAACEFDPDRRLPVDVGGIVARKGIQVRIDAQSTKSIEARLVPLKDSLAIDLKQGVTASRRRFSLAHELGHTIFYRRDRNGFSHQIGVTSDDERLAEERICNLFAQTLLIPRALVDRSFAGPATERPKAIISAIEKTAQACDVSPLVVLCRLNALALENTSFLAICCRYKPNKANGGRLRVEHWFPFAWPRRLFIAHGRSVDGLELHSPIRLFEAWRLLPPSASGRFGLRADFELATGSEACADEFDEMLRTSTVVDGKWRETALPVRVANYLYARHESTEQDAYVLSILTPDRGFSRAEAP